MLRDFKLAGNELLVFALINQHSQMMAGFFTGDNKYIQLMTGIETEKEVIDILASLANKGLIEMCNVNVDGVLCTFMGITKKVLNR